MKQLILLLLFPFTIQAQNRILDITGIAAPLPNVSITGTFPMVFSNVAGSYSSDITFSFTGSNLVGSVTWTAGTGMQVSTDGSTWSNTAVYTQSGGNASGTVHNRVNSTTAAGSYSGYTTATSPTMTAVPQASWTSTVAVTPALSRSPTSLTGLNSVAGSPGTAQTVTVTFAGTTITVTPPANVEVSKDGTNYGSSQTLTSGSPVAVYARVPAAATAGTTISGNISFSGSGVTTLNTSVAGTVSSATTNDTIDIKPWDSLGHTGLVNGGKYTSTTTNFWAPTSGVTASLTSPNLLYNTGVQSPIYITVAALNDYAASAAGYGTSNTIGYAQPVFNVCMYNTAAMTFVFHGVASGSYKMDVVSSTGAGTGPYVQSFAVGATTQSGVNAFNNLGTLVALSPLTPTSGTLTCVITPTNSFTVITHIRLIRLN